MSEYLRKWKEVLGSTKLRETIEYVDSIKFYKFDSERDKLLRESETRVRMLRKKLEEG